MADRQAREQRWGRAEPGGRRGISSAAGNGRHAPEGGIRVLIVDDQQLLRQSLAQIIDDEPDLSVVGQAADGAEATVRARETRPDVILMDIRMPRVDGLEATRRICADPVLAGTRVLVLSMFELDEYVYEALRVGASGFLLKDDPPDDMVEAIRRTHRGESLFAPSILTRLVEHYVAMPRPRSATSPLHGLTERERDVLALIGTGRSNAEIAEAFAISVKTVKTHISHLMTKIVARDRAQLVIAAYDTGLVRPHSETSS